MLLNVIWRRRRSDIQEFRVYMCKTYEGGRKTLSTKEISFYEKLSAEEVIHFLVFSGAL